jgi:uncharacterized membrane protein YdbT with pleckstrin-like domain
MELHQGETPYFSGHPSWRGSFAYHAWGIIAAVALGVVAYLIQGVGLGVVVAAVVAAGVILVSFVRRIATTYTITDERLIIERGIVAKHMQQTRIDRVQNVNTNQSVLERVLRVGVVDFDTAGTDGGDFQFVGVANPAEVVTVVDRAQRSAMNRERAGGVGGV